MPLWVLLVLLGVVLSVLGFAGLGNLVLWAGLALVVVGLVVSVLSWLRRDRGTAPDAPDVPAKPSPGELTWRRRAARLGWVTLGLALLSATLLGLAVWAVATAPSRTVPERPQNVIEWIERAVLPVPALIPGPRLVTVLGVGLAAAAVLVGMAALHASAAMRVLSRGRYVTDPLPGEAARMGRRILGPVAMRALIENPPGWPVTAIPPDAGARGIQLRCTVLIPAHDEEAVLGRTLASLTGQIRPPDRVVVVADNCTDGTVGVARVHGVEVVETVGNTRHKAGALNQVLSRLLMDVGVDQVFLVMDADSTITPDFLAEALTRLQDDPDLMAVGGLFSGESGAGLLGQMQRNEFARYQRIINRREGRVFVLTGTASVFRGYAMRAVAEARGTLVPGTTGEVYDTQARTEDNEVTLALKSLGARTVSPSACKVTTEVMPTPRDLWRQRSRWQRGAVENVAAYGFTRATAVYWWQQFALGYGVLAFNAYLLLLAVALLATEQLHWSWFWLVIGAIFLAERLVTAWRAGWSGRALAAPLVLELAYAWYLQLCFVTSLVRLALGREAGWNYVPRQHLSAVAPLLAATALISGWNPLPPSVLGSPWFEAGSLFVAVNTLVYAVLAVFQMLPPIRRSIHRLQRRRAAGRLVVSPAAESPISQSRRTA